MKSNIGKNLMKSNSWQKIDEVKCGQKYEVLCGEKPDKVECGQKIVHPAFPAWKFQEVDPTEISLLLISLSLVSMVTQLTVSQSLIPNRR